VCKMFLLCKSAIMAAPATFGQPNNDCLLTEDQIFILAGTTGKDKETELSGHAHAAM
jgi:hypothetical protein